MTSKIKVDNINKVSDDSNIINKCGTTITLGASGDSIALASGASQTGFGRTGTVDWQTGSIKTTTFTAVNGEGYFVDTSGGAVTSNLPAGSAGAIVSFSDYTRTFNTNNLTISPNGSEKIGGVAASLTLNVNGQALTLVYVDATEGWINVQNAEDTEEGGAFITATGGTITTVDTNFKVHTFTGPGTFCVSAGSGSLAFVDYLVVAGGGGGGKGNNPEGGGGGGAGGYRESHADPVSGPYATSPLVSSTSIPISPQGYPITVGAGGTTPGGVPCRSGSNSTALGITSAGGGRGAQSGDACGATGGPGGSGGGGGSGTSSVAAGNGNDPATTPPQGQPGGAGGGGPTGPQGKYTGAGGGGATEAGVAASGRTGGRGGAGTPTSITGAAVAYAGGGGSGGAYPTSACFGNQGAGSPCGTGGAGGCRAQGTAGTVNKGGGGGGAGNTETGGAGGSGIVIIRYKFQ